MSSILWFVLGAVAGHTAGIETCSTGTFDIPVAFKFEIWMEE